MIPTSTGWSRRCAGVFPLDGFHVPARLARFIRSDPFEVRVDHDFGAVIDACAAPAAGRRKTWINSTIRSLYGELFQRGFCHTIECYQGGELVGGLYGVSLGGAFFGESMFHRVTDGSKVALAHLVARLIRGGYVLLDTQFVTPHLATLGLWNGRRLPIARDWSRPCSIVPRLIRPCGWAARRCWRSSAQQGAAVSAPCSVLVDDTDHPLHPGQGLRMDQAVREWSLPAVSCFWPVMEVSSLRG